MLRAALQKMLELWMIALAVLLILFHPEPTESSSNYCLNKDIKREIKRADENAVASLSCPSLAKDEKYISIDLHKKGDTTTDLRNNTHQLGQRFKVSQINSSVSFMILRTEANDTGLYTCTLHTKNGPLTTQTILLIKDACSLDQPTEPPVTCPANWTLPLIIGCAILGVYSMLITIGCFWACKLKSTKTNEGIYMNTRPGGLRRR